MKERLLLAVTPPKPADYDYYEIVNFGISATATAFYVISICIYCYLTSFKSLDKSLKAIIIGTLIFLCLKTSCWGYLAFTDTNNDNSRRIIMPSIERVSSYLL